MKALAKPEALAGSLDDIGSWARAGVGPTIMANAIAKPGPRFAPPANIESDNLLMYLFSAVRLTSFAPHEQSAVEAVVIPEERSDF
jgi:hypothetical protein